MGFVVMGAIGYLVKLSTFRSVSLRFSTSFPFFRVGGYRGFVLGLGGQGVTGEVGRTVGEERVGRGDEKRRAKGLTSVVGGIVHIPVNNILVGGA